MLEPRPYAEWVHNEVFSPVVVVIGTETAQRSVREAHALSLAELFGPFGGRFRPVAARCRCLERQTRVEDFRVRFVDAGCTAQWSTAHAEQVASCMVEASASKGHKDGGFSPWYEQWRLAVFSSLRWSEHEGLDQPAAAVLVASSQEPDPVALFEQLLHSSYMPPLCAQGVLDPVPSRAAVLLHDLANDGGVSEADLQAKMQRVEERLGNAGKTLVLCLRIHRGPGATRPEIKDLFAPFVAVPAKPAPPPAEGSAAANSAATAGPCPVPGQGLTGEDLEALSQAMSDVVTKQALPWMEERVQQLEAQISQTRKGFSNQLKYLWRKPREVGATASAPSSNSGQAAKAESGDAGPVYALHTVEGQMRLAGDLSFFLRDYEAALGYYRNVVSDFKQDRAWKHVAGAYEMWGLCAYISGARRSECMKCMESAYDHYLQAGAGRHAMRAVVLQQAMVCDSREAAARLMKVNGDMSDGGLRSAMVLEQAGQLYCQAGSVRKGCFHVVLAGHTFNKLGFKRLALQSYRGVVDMYSSKDWWHITDHFHFTMARQAYQLNMVEEALAHFTRLLNSFAADKRVNIQAEREAIYLKEFLFVVRNFTEKRSDSHCQPGADLQIPCIGQSISVMLPGDAREEPPPPPPPPPPPSTPNAQPALPGQEDAQETGAPESVPWDSMGEKLLPALSQDDRLELQWRSKRVERVFDSLQRVVAVGAEVWVEVELSNPMKLKLELSSAVLSGDLETPESSSVAKEPDSDLLSSCDLSTEASTEILDTPRPGAGGVEFRPQTVVLEPLETKRVRLLVIPKRPGLLRIRGVSWKLEKQLQCHRPLFVKGRRLRATLEQRASGEGWYSTDHRLQVRVRETVPQVSARLEGWPSPGSAPLLQGEMRACSLIIGGDWGGSECLRLATSHPAFLTASSSSSRNAGAQVEYDGEVLVLHRPSASEAGGELRVPLTLRADRAGRHVVRLCLLAEDVGEGPKHERRQWVTLEKHLRVCPSLTCSVRQSPSFQEAGRLLFTCVLDNRSPEPLEIVSTRCVAGGRQLALEDCVQPGGSRHCVEPGQMMQLLFSLRHADGRPLAEAPAAEIRARASGHDVDDEARQSLLAASRATGSGRAGGPPTSPPSSPAAAAASAAAAQERVDLAMEWETAGGRHGEAYALGVQCEGPSVSPCPLDMQLLAPESATLSPGLTLPVELRVRNASAVGPVSFYFVADAPPEFMWLGCERSETIRLPPLGSHKATLHAYFTSPGVFNLNRFRLFVVALPPGAGAVPASEQAPLAFAFPFERLVQVFAAEVVQGFG